MQLSQSVSFKDQVHSLTFRVVCYTTEPDLSHLSVEIYGPLHHKAQGKKKKKMSMLFKATLYVPSHDNSWADIRAT